MRLILFAIFEFTTCKPKPYYGCDSCGYSSGYLDDYDDYLGTSMYNNYWNNQYSLMPRFSSYSEFDSYFDTYYPERDYLYYNRYPAYLGYLNYNSRRFYKRSLSLKTNLDISHGVEEPNNVDKESRPLKFPGAKFHFGLWSHHKLGREKPLDRVRPGWINKHPHLSKTTGKSEVTTGSTTISESTSKKEEVTTAKENVTTAKENVTTAKENVTTAKENVTTAKEEVTTTKENVTTTKENVTTAKEEVTTAKENVTTAKEEVATAKDIVTTAKDEVTTAKEEVTTAKEEDLRNKREISNETEEEYPLTTEFPSEITTDINELTTRNVESSEELKEEQNSKINETSSIKNQSTTTTTSRLPSNFDSDSDFDFDLELIKLSNDIEMVIIDLRDLFFIHSMSNIFRFNPLLDSLWDDHNISKRTIGASVNKEAELNFEYQVGDIIKKVILPSINNVVSTSETFFNGLSLPKFSIGLGHKGHVAVKRSSETERINEDIEDFIRGLLKFFREHVLPNLLNALKEIDIIKVRSDTDLTGIPEEIKEVLLSKRNVRDVSNKEYDSVSEILTWMKDNGSKKAEQELKNRIEHDFKDDLTKFFMERNNVYEEQGNENPESSSFGIESSYDPKFEQEVDESKLNAMENEHVEGSGNESFLFGIESSYDPKFEQEVDESKLNAMENEHVKGSKNESFLFGIESSYDPKFEQEVDESKLNAMENEHVKGSENGIDWSDLFENNGNDDHVKHENELKDEALINWKSSDALITDFNRFDGPRYLALQGNQNLNGEITTENTYSTGQQALAYLNIGAACVILVGGVFFLVNTIMRRRSEKN